MTCCVAQVRVPGTHLLTHVEHAPRRLERLKHTKQQRTVSQRLLVSDNTAQYNMYR